MKRIITLILLALVLVAPAVAQTPSGAAIIFTARYGPAWATAKNLAPAKACTTDFWTWYWAGSMSNQIFVGGRAGDSVAIETKVKQANYNAVLAWKTNSDSILTTDSIIGTGWGKLIDYSNKVDCSYGGVVILTNKSWTLDTAKSLQDYPVITPAK